MPRPRRFALPVTLWVYGIAITVTLVSIWGRAVVVDSDLMADAAAKVASPRLAAAQVEAWLAEELATMPGVGRSEAETAATDTAADPTFLEPVERLVREVVLATTVPRGETAVVDVAGALRPMIPAMSDSLARQGVDVTDESLAALLGSLDPLVVRQPNELPVVGARSPAARNLSLATVLGLVTVLVSGVIAVRLAEDRREMLRTLLTRVAVSAFTFVVMFQLGAWVLDPGAGRAPVRSALASVATAKLWVPALVAVGAAGAATAVRKQLHAREGSGAHPDEPHHEEEDTREYEEAVH